MSTETRLFVRMPHSMAGVVAATQLRSDAALARAAKAPVGDRVEVVRYERAQAEIELLAVVAANALNPVIRQAGGPLEQRRSCVVSLSAFPGDVTDVTGSTLRTWLGAGYTVIELVSPFVAGVTGPAVGTGHIAPVADVWKSISGARGQDAVRERFLTQLGDAVDKREAGMGINPSGVPNSALTEGLRAFATTGDSPPQEVAVVYRDGSSAATFPMRGLNLVSDGEPVGEVFSFALLSIRHVALDVLVDGAWLRNSEISRIRPAGQTDELVYRESRRQITELCRDGPATIMIYQTGLEPAIVGFYRAVARHLASSPGTLTVLPRYFQKGRPYAEGTPWGTR